MFENRLIEAMNNIGMSEDAFQSLLRDEPYLSDNKLFVISRLFNTINPNIFLSKKVGNLFVRCRRFDIAIIYTINTTNPCNVIVDFNKLDLQVEYKDKNLIINSNLLDYKGEKNKLIDLRQEVLNEILIRYFSKALFALYKELGWYL